jgi:hypothetical protein
MSQFRVLLLATTTGYQVRSFGEAAQKLGIELVFATDRCDRLEDPWWDEAIPIRFHDEERSLSAMLHVVRERPISGILAVGDRPTQVASALAGSLGMPGHPPEAAAAARNKLAFRAALDRAGLPCPGFVALPLDADIAAVAPHMHYPCVVKPIALSGSRGVIRADDAQELVAAFERVRALLMSAAVRAERDIGVETILVEAFMRGREYAVEALLEHGRLRTLAIFDKPDPLNGPFFEETIYVTPAGLSADSEARVLRAIADAAAAVGLHHGPVHAECRVNDTGVYVLEVAARPIGGLCSRALRFTASPPSDVPLRARQASPLPPARADASEQSISFEELLLRHAIGEDVSGYAREQQASGVMMIPIPRRGIFKGVAGEEAARAVGYVHDLRITAKVDQVLVPLPEGSSYLGFIFARAPTPDAVVAALRAAHARLDFRIDRALM